MRLKNQIWENIPKMKSTLRPNPKYIMAGTEKFQRLLGDRSVALEITDDADETLHNLVEKLRDEMPSSLSKKICKKQRTGNKAKLSAETLQYTLFIRAVRLEQANCEMERRDLRSSNTSLVEEAIDRNLGSKVFTQQIGRSHLKKLKAHDDGSTVLSKLETSAEIEEYTKEYAPLRFSVVGINARAPTFCS